MDNGTLALRIIEWGAGGLVVFLVVGFLFLALVGAMFSDAE